MPEPTFTIQRIYVKDSSFVTENTPKLFQQLGALKHEMDLKTEHTELEEKDHYEVVLNISVITKIQEEENEALVASTVKVKQAGVFQLQNFDEKQQEQILQVYCPEILYPYARHSVAQLVVMSSLPAVTLMPVNFQSLYQQEQQQSK